MAAPCRFDDVFRLDAEGLPRRWTKSDNIEEIFKEARQQVGTMLTFFLYFFVPDVSFM